MSKLDIRIQNAIENQLTVVKKISKLKEELQANEYAYSNTIGKLSVLSDLYKEETGRNLQHDLDNDPSWKERLQAITKRVQENAGDDAPETEPTAAVAPVESPEPQPSPVQPQEDKVEQDVARRRRPAKITVDDNPPGPGPDED